MFSNLHTDPITAIVIALFSILEGTLLGTVGSISPIDLHRLAVRLALIFLVAFFAGCYFFVRKYGKLTAREEAIIEKQEAA